MGKSREMTGEDGKEHWMWFIFVLLVFLAGCWPTAFVTAQTLALRRHETPEAAHSTLLPLSWNAAEVSSALTETVLLALAGIAATPRIGGFMGA